METYRIVKKRQKRAEVDAASCNPKLPKHVATWQTRTRQPEPNRKFCSVPGPSSRTFGWIFAKMRHFVSHLSPGRGPFPSKFPNFGLHNVPNLPFTLASKAKKRWSAPKVLFVAQIAVSLKSPLPCQDGASFRELKSCGFEPCMHMQSSAVEHGERLRCHSESERAIAMPHGVSNGR